MHIIFTYNVLSGSNGYKFAFNGKEKETEFNEGVYDFGARLYDGKIGRWMSVDPLITKYPFYSPYISFGNNPILFIDPDGKQLFITISEQAVNDIYSLVPGGKDGEYGKDITITDAGEVIMSVELQDLWSKNLHDPKNTAGVTLLYNLITSDKKYLYEASDNATYQVQIPSLGIVKRSLDLIKSDETGIKNLSEFPSKEGAAKDGERDLPKSGYNGQVVIAESLEWQEIDGNKQIVIKPRSSVVFHELWEVWEKTDNELPRLYNKRDQNGQFISDPNDSYNFLTIPGTGAHGNANAAEDNFHERSNQPGCGVPLLKQ